MQVTGPRARRRTVPKFSPVRFLWYGQSETAGFMLQPQGKPSYRSKHWLPGFVRCLRMLAELMPDPPDHSSVQQQSPFRDNFASLLFGSKVDLRWLWPQVKFHIDFEAIKHVIQYVLTREIQIHHLYYLLLLGRQLQAHLQKKTLGKKNIIWRRLEPKPASWAQSRGEICTGTLRELVTKYGFAWATKVFYMLLNFWENYFFEKD